MNSEIISIRFIKSILLGVLILSVTGLLIPMLFYVHNFYTDSLSESNADWGTFGDFIGGTVGSVFNFSGALLSLISIYVTCKIAIHLQNYDENNNKETEAREHLKSKRDLNLVYKQNQPLPFIDLSRSDVETKISLCNYGIGPMILQNWVILYKNIEYKDFNELFSNIKYAYSKDEIYVLHSSSKNRILPPNSDSILFHIMAKSNELNKYSEFQYKWREIFKNTSIKIMYTDIFDRKFSYHADISFLKN